jgi:hypothetical protein
MSAKPDLPPLGGRKNLKKAMPRKARFKGESFEARDIVRRYHEHMEKQRAAAAEAQSRPENGDE